MAKNEKMIAIIFDTETTGLIENPARKLEKQPEIISFASQKINLATGEYFESYEKLFRPLNLISNEITKITGISNDLVEHEHTFDYYIDDVIQILEAAPLLIGQNLGFDMDMVELECRRYKRKIIWPRTMDIVQNTIHLKGYRLSLTNLHLELFGKAFEGAHKANVDVAITCKCAIELYKRGLL
jgi:DNA polymerase III epsilon subunit-like protein